MNQFVSDPVIWDFTGISNAFIKLDCRKHYCRVVIDVVYYVGAINNQIIYNEKDYYYCLKENDVFFINYRFISL